MSLAETTCRGRQEAHKVLERARFASRGWGTPGAILAREAPAFAEPAAAREHLRRVTGARFFAGVAESHTVDMIGARLSDACHGVVARADEICGRRFHLLGYPGLRFGDPVDWHVDPVSGKRAPLVHWSRIDPLDWASVGDSKVIWELNRHQWLVTLAEAHRMTGHPRYLATAGDLFDSWLVHNPPGIGINWSSSLEVALRLIAWCWAFTLLSDTTWLSGERLSRVLVAVQAHAAHIERYLSYYFSPNTHLTGEALGLFYAGSVFREFRQAARWRDLGHRILVDQSRHQIGDDGVYVEQATCYQRYTAEIYLHFLILADRNHVAVPVEVRDRVARLLDFLLSAGQPPGTMPNIGDADGGWLLPLVPRRPNDCRGVFGLAAALFDRSDCAWAAGGPGAEVFWLMGSDGVARFDRLKLREPAMPASRAFPAGGYAVMRSDWSPQARRLIVDVGPLAGDASGAHGHADLLSLQCSADGDDYLVDPGTFGYADPVWRRHFRGTSAHSTIVIDGIGQAEPARAFSWRTRPRATLREWRSTDAIDVLDADHDGYAGLSDPVRHRRRVLFVKPRYWVVVDDLIGAAEHDVDLRFQFSPRPVTLQSDLWAVAHGRASGGLWIRPFSSAPLHGTVYEGREHPIEGWVAPDYGQRQPAPVVVYTTHAVFPLRIVTLLFPVDDVTTAPPAVRAHRDARGSFDELTLVDECETIRVDDRSVSIEQHTAATRS